MESAIGSSSCNLQVKFVFFSHNAVGEAGRIMVEF